mmetsp:Transcript_16496/g.40397  ORF Transcript_16496/g.40397 Transcript_16496/m.40397 type:complete len:275 (+) Transcript_16496:257-1081(+)
MFPSPSVSASRMHSATTFLASALNGLSLFLSSSDMLMNTSSATSLASMVPLPSLSSMSNACATQLGYSLLLRSSASQSTSAARNSLTSMHPSLVVSNCSSSCLHSSGLISYPARRSPASSSAGSTRESPEVSSSEKRSRNSAVSSRCLAITPSTPANSRSLSPSRRSTERLSSPYVLKRCRRATTWPPMGCVRSPSLSADCCSHGWHSAAAALMRRSGSRSMSFLTRSTHSADSRFHGSLSKSMGSSRMARNTSLALGRLFTLSTKGRRPVSSW